MQQQQQQQQQLQEHCILEKPPDAWHAIPLPDRKRVNDVLSSYYAVCGGEFDPQDVQIEIVQGGDVYRIDFFLHPMHSVDANVLCKLQESSSDIIGVQCNFSNCKTRTYARGALEVFVASAEYQCRMRANTINGILASGNNNNNNNNNNSSSTTTTATTTNTHNALQSNHMQLCAVISAAYAACPHVDD
jgi:hypothetical protein